MLVDTLNGLGRVSDGGLELSNICIICTNLFYCFR